jgi:molybdenum cofactor biosynthesis enzyme MoaA
LKRGDDLRTLPLDAISVSLNAADAAEHKQKTGTDTWADVIQGIQWLRYIGRDPMLSFVLTRQYLPKMEAWFRDRATRKQEMTSLTAKREQAQKENVARTAQTAKPAKTPPRNQQNGQFKEAPAEKPRLSMGQLKRRVLAGKPIPGDDDYTD